MELATLIGIILGYASCIGGALMEGTELEALFEPSALMIIIGGTTGATMACYTMEELKSLVGTAKKAFLASGLDIAEIFETFGELATVARREGVLALENRPIKLENSLLKRGIRLVVDGMEPALLKDLLTTQLVTEEQKAKSQASIFASAGGFAPTLGIIGTVMGLVHVLGNLSDPSKLGPAISVAFIATLYGISFANLIFLPMGKKLGFVAKQETQIGLLIIEGLLSIQSGDNPRVVQEKLISFIEESKWESVRSKQAMGGKE